MIPRASSAVIPAHATTTVAIFALSAASRSLPSARASVIRVSMRSTAQKPARLVRPITLQCERNTA